MSRIARVTALTIAAVAPAAAASPLPAQGTERHTLAGADAAVYDPAGRVQVVAGDGTDVVVEVARGGRDGARLRVATGRVRGANALRVIAPDRDLVYPALGRWSNTTLRVRDDGTFDGGGGGGGFFSRGQLTVRGGGSGAEAWADLVVRVPRGRRVAVHLGAGTLEARNVDGDITLNVHAATVVTERTRGRLVVDAGSGSVHVSDAEGAEVNLDTGSGGVEVRGVHAERLRVDAGSGSVRGRDVDARDVNLDTGSGGMQLERVRARTVKLDAGSGRVDLELLGDVDDARIDTGSGGITLRLPPTLGAMLDVDTGSGGVRADVPLEVTRRERDHLTGRLGDGRGRIVIDAGSGGVRLVPAR